MSFDLGDPVPLAVQTRDSSGNLANAGTVTLTIGLPDGTTTTPAVTNPSPGVYQVFYPTVQAGHHTVRWLGTGINSSAYADSFDVLSTSPAYIVSLARAKRKLRIPLADTEHDEDIRDYIESATSVIERHRREIVVRRMFTDYHRTWGARELILYNTPALSLISVQTVDGLFTWDLATLHLNGVAGIVTEVSGIFGVTFSGYIKVVYEAGSRVIPADFQRAGLIIIEHLWQTERPGSQAGPYPGAYEDSMEGIRRTGTGFAIPNRALELLGPSPTMVR